MTFRHTPLQYAFFELGGKTAVAALLKVSRQIIHYWVKHGFPVDRCASIEAATNGLLNRQLLRPNDWHIHWPELVVKARPHPAGKNLDRAVKGVGGAHA
jgi:DNA-binding transcriptional regulator YdaS (Cro superfamily)